MHGPQIILSCSIIVDINHQLLLKVTSPISRPRSRTGTPTPRTASRPTTPIPRVGTPTKSPCMPTQRCPHSRCSGCPQQCNHQVKIPQWKCLRDLLDHRLHDELLVQKLKLPRLTNSRIYHLQNFQINFVTQIQMIFNN